MQQTAKEACWSDKVGRKEIGSCEVAGGSVGDEREVGLTNSLLRELRGRELWETTKRMTEEVPWVEDDAESLLKRVMGRQSRDTDRRC